MCHAISTLVESLPVFPCCIAPDVRVSMVSPAAEGTCGCTGSRLTTNRAGYTTPSGTEAIVHFAFVRIRENGVGCYDETVSFQPQCLWYIVVMVMLLASPRVGMV